MRAAVLADWVVFQPLRTGIGNPISQPVPPQWGTAGKIPATVSSGLQRLAQIDRWNFERFAVFGHGAPGDHETLFS